MRPQGFPAKLRLKQRREFLRVQRGGRKIHVRHFMVFSSPRRTVKTQPAPKRGGGGDADGEGRPVPDSSSLPPTRCGITVTRKVGNAVVRNRIKRLVREVFRQNRTRLPPGLDIVWVAKQQAAEANFSAVQADFERLLVELERAPSRRDRDRRDRSRQGKGRGKGRNDKDRKRGGAKQGDGRATKRREPAPKERGQ
ncbi:ribonuclease P protein component [Plesiocystis pacifica SIR-1]|uniref:Ribonuclease P protein component n=1 Tax=Plesiocystis pacifica SIR-1 TaxID=391625 RepID=A6G3S5_9BACT|nr:ribonuclease P protein component [Plesiocystis pacifica]EDM79462.1 ribonuclease P protein component [Plesiocystis pacifica SIR-1]